MDTDKKNFKVDLQRARVYWDYYKTLFFMACLAVLTGIISVSLLHLAGSLNLFLTAIMIIVLYLMLLVMFLLMTFIVWRHENRHLDELMEIALTK